MGKKSKYDFSDYLKDHQYNDATNKKVIGKFKDWCNSVPIAEFVRLRSNMYSIKKSDLSENFWYNTIREDFGKQVKLLNTISESLLTEMSDESRLKSPI